MSPMGRGLSHWWRRLVTGGLMDWRRFEGTLRPFVMPGLDPGIHVFRATDKKVVDGRDKPGHDGGESYTTGFTPGSALTRSRKAAPRISKLRYWSKEAHAGDSSTTGSVRPEASASRA